MADTFALGRLGFLDQLQKDPQTFATTGLVVEQPGEEGLTSEREKNSIAYQAATTEAKMVGEESEEDALKRFNEKKTALGMTMGYQNVLDQVTLLKSQGDKEGLRTLVDEYLKVVDPPQAAELAAGLMPLEEDIDEMAIAPAAFERVQFELQGDITRAEKNAIGMQFMMNTLGLIMDKEGEWEFISNSAGFLLNDVNIDVSRWAESGFWDAGKVGSNMIINFKKQPIEKQVAVWPELVQSILKATDDNERKAVATLLKFLSPTGDTTLLNEANWDIGFWGFDVATLAVGPLVRAITGTTRAGSQASKIAKRLGDIDRAAETTVANVIDDSGTAARSLNTPRDVAATNLSPVSGIGVDAQTFTANVSGRAMKALQSVEQEVGRQLSGENLLRGELLTPKEQQVFGDKFLGKWRTAHDQAGVRFNEVKLGNTSDLGFDVIADYGTKDTGDLYRSASGARKRMATLKSEGFLKGEISVVPKDEGFVIRSQQKVNFKITDGGTFEGKATKGPIAAFFTSPSYHLVPFFGAKSKILRSANLAELGSAKILNDFNLATREVLKPLGVVAIPGTRGRRSLQKIDQILLQGDSHLDQVGNDTVRGKIYSVAELRDGIIVPGKKGDEVIKLETEAEIQAYYGMRRIFDLLYSLKNEGKRRALVGRGQKEITLGADGDITIGRPFETFESGVAHLEAEQPRMIFDPRANRGSGGIVSTDRDFIKAGYTQGYQLVRLDSPRKVGTGHVQTMLVHNDGIKELPQRVLNYKQGYVPKIYQDGYYFVKQDVQGTLEGVSNQVVGRNTLRIFASKKAAEAWKVEQEALRAILKEGNDLGTPTAKADMRRKLSDLGHSEEEIAEMEVKIANQELNFGKIAVFSDREVGTAKLDEEALGVSGGLFDSPRAKHDILFGTDGEVPRRASAFESLQRNIGHVSNYVPRNEWRMGMQERWMKTARSMQAIRPSITNFREARASVTLEAGTKERASLISAANWIDDQARIPTLSEKWYQNVVRDWAEWADGVPGLGRPSNWALRFSGQDPIGWARSAAFHGLLGWFNPAQLFVQAQGASIAMSLHPQHAIKGLRGGFGLTSVAFVDASNKAGAAYVKAAGKALGYDAEEFFLMKQMLDQSGLVTSIKQTADHAAAIQGHGVGFDAVRRSVDNGLYFYRRGEMFNRTYGLTTAIERWKGNTGKALKQMSSDEFKDVLEEAIALNLNMFRANRAAWQKGVLSIPTQFMQIQAKWIESMMGVGALGELNRAQKTRFAMMQFALYGSAGIPLGNLMAGHMGNWLGMEPEDTSENTKRFVNGGAWDLMLGHGLDAYNEFGARGAIANDIVENMVGILTDEAPATGMMGAFGEIPSRAIAAVNKLAPLVANANKVNWSERELLFAASEVAKISATWRNATKAYMMQRTMTLKDRKNNILIDKRSEGGFNLGTIFGQAIGFQASDAAAVNQLRRVNAYNDTIVADMTNTILDHYYDYLSQGSVVAGIGPSDDAAENTKAVTDYYMEMLDPGLRRRVRASLKAKIFAGEDVRTQQIKKWLRLQGEQYVDTLMGEGSLKFNPLLTGPGTGEE